MSQSFGEQLLGLLPRLGRFFCPRAHRLDRGRERPGSDGLPAGARARATSGCRGTRLDSWMFRIVRTVWIDELRGRKVRLGRGIVDAEDEIVVDGPRVIESRLTLDTVRRAVATLPEAQREVLMLVCVEGLSYRETAETLGLPMGTVMSRLARARLTIARLTEDNKDNNKGDEHANVVRWS
ncbi:MAG: RNA polymerase sigma factor [Pseudomonadota bacterium]